MLHAQSTLAAIPPVTSCAAVVIDGAPVLAELTASSDRGMR